MVCGSLGVGRNCLDAVKWTIVCPRCHFLRIQQCLSYPELVSLKYCIYLYVSIYDPTCQATDENHWYGSICATSYLLMSAIVSIFGAHFCRWWDPSVLRKVVNVRTTHRLISWQHNIHSIDRIYQTTSQECKSRPQSTFANKIYITDFRRYLLGIVYFLKPIVLDMAVLFFISLKWHDVTNCMQISLTRRIMENRFQWEGPSRTPRISMRISL